MYYNNLPENLVELKGRFNSFIVTAFDDSMTVEMQMRAMIKWIKMNVKLTNELVDYLNGFIKNFDDKLYTNVEDILQVWLNEGLLADVIREMINEEVVVARGTHPNLNARLNKMEDTSRQNTAQLAHMTISTLEPPDISLSLKGDGLTDDTENLNELILFMVDNGYRDLYFPPTEKGYLINGIVDIPSNINLKGNNTKIIVNNMPHILNGENTGIFNVKGSFDSVEKFLVSDLLKGEQFASVSDASDIKVGSMLHFEVTAPDSEYIGLSFVTVVRAVNLNNNTIELVDTPQHDFLVAKGAKVRQFKQKENIGIDGFHFEINHSELVNVIQTYYVDGLTIKNISSSGHGGSTLAINATLNGVIDRVDSKNASNREPGRGYAVKVHTGSSRLNISNVLGDFVRHCVDIGGASKNITVTDCVGINTTSTSFGLHGMRENNIIFNNCISFNCESGVTVGNGAYYRSGDVKILDCLSYNCGYGFNIAEGDNIQLIRCKSYNSTLTGFQVIYGNNIYVENCEINGGFGFVIQRSENVSINNLKTFNIKSNVSGLLIYYNAENIIVDGYENDGTGVYGIRLGEILENEEKYVKNVVIRNSNITSDGEYAVAVLHTCEKITFTNNQITGNTLFQRTVKQGVFKDNYIHGGHVQISPIANFLFKDNYGSFTTSFGEGMVEGENGFYNIGNISFASE